MAIAAGADALGLVGDMPSGPGIINDDLARTIAEFVPPPISTFLLTSHKTPDEIAEHVRSCGTSAVQITRHIDPAHSAELARSIPTIRRIQVIHIEDETALDLIPVYSPHIHAFLLDSGRPTARQVELGGTGRTHDWRVSAEFVRRSAKPVFLAGGLNADNVVAAIRTVKPYGVDLCTGVRTDSRLNSTKLNHFMEAVQSAT